MQSHQLLLGAYTIVDPPKATQRFPSNPEPQVSWLSLLPSLLLHHVTRCAGVLLSGPPLCCTLLKSAAECAWLTVKG